MKKLQRAGEPESPYSRNPLLPFFLSWDLLSRSSPSGSGSGPLLSGQGPPFISQGDTTRTTSTYFLFWWGPILFSLKLGPPSLHKWAEICNGCRPNDLLMGRPIPTSTSAGSRCDVGTWLSADDMTSVRPVTNQSFLSTTCQSSNLHVRPSSYNILLVMVGIKPGIYLTGTNVPSPGGNTPAPARDECLETLILTGWGEACVRPPVAT
jgi:hypothetical protein